ncbi:MAG: hypothetical protein J3K34DRAFT_391245 [Monoraphidium minutum]|nr:MAG: hypothetical protein J3K34DRAFT_391245 [Monoraphidium minutum]
MNVPPVSASLHLQLCPCTTCIKDDVAAAPLLVRALAYTSACAAWQMAVLLLVWAVLLTAERAGACKKNTKEPSENVWTMLAVNLEGFYTYYVMPGFVLAWYNPTWESWSYDFSFTRLLWYQLPIMAMHDTVFFWLHVWGHVSKWAFNNVHGYHHQRKAILNGAARGGKGGKHDRCTRGRAGITATAYDTWLDALGTSPPLALIAWLALLQNNYWALLVPLHTAAIIFVMGHCGYQLNLDDTLGAAFLALNPFLISAKLTASAMRPMDHEMHHADPRVNFALFFTWWDEATGRTWPRDRLAPTLLLHALTTLGFYVPYAAYVELAIWRAPATFWSLVGLLALAPPIPRAAYRLLGGRVARFVTRLPLWDAARRDFGVTYAAGGEPGAFKADPSRRYIFCYQPWGIQARGAAAWAGPGRGGRALGRAGMLRGAGCARKGRDSPAAPLADCKLAVSKVLWSLPLGQQLAAACGCCDASWRTLTELLTDETPKSVCVMPGGYDESKYAESYKVVLRRRRGFARLSAATGAALVPVIGIGEPFVAGEPPGTRVGVIFKAVVAYRPYPLQLVFGAPITPAAGEGADTLHARYTDGLLALAKAHGVPLTVAE